MRVYKTFYLPLCLAVLLSLNIMGCGAGGAGTGVVTAGENQQQTLLKAENISNTYMDSFKPVISADAAGNVYVTWEEGNKNTMKKVYLGTSLNAGLAFSVNNDITKKIGYTISSPSVMIKKNGEFAVVWVDNKDILYSYTKNYGDTFSPADPPENISKSDSDSSEPLIGLEGTLSGFEGTLGIDAVWVEGSAGSRHIAFSRAAGPESTFSTPQKIFSAAIDSDCPVITAAGSGKIYVAYRGDNKKIYFARWESNTSSFYDIGYVWENSVSPSCPDVGVSSTGIIYVVWSDMGRIWIANSTDTGYSFHNSPKAITDTTGNASSPKIAIDGSYINLVWVEDEAGNGDIFYSGSVDNGQSFSPPRNLSNTAGPSQAPAITTDSNKYIYVAWTEGTEGNRDIYFIRDTGARGLVKF